MDAQKRSGQIVRLSRIAIDDKTLAQLAGASRLVHIPIQDLVGGACLVALALSHDREQRWHNLARALRDARRRQAA